MTEPIKSDHPAFMMVVKLKDVQRHVDEAIRSLVEVGPSSGACWVRNAQIELVKVAEEITLWAARRPNYQQQLTEKEKAGE